MQNPHVALVAQIYSELTSGDTRTLMANLHEDVDWEFGASDYDIPWLKPGHGVAAVKRFLQASSSLNFARFSLHTVAGNGLWVVGLFSIEFTVRETGRTVREECEAQIWRFDPSGKIVAVRHAADTHQHWLAANQQGAVERQCNPVQLTGSQGED